jgi:hypothetical protein
MYARPLFVVVGIFGPVLARFELSLPRAYSAKVGTGFAHQNTRKPMVFSELRLGFP